MKNELIARLMILFALLTFLFFIPNSIIKIRRLIRWLKIRSLKKTGVKIIVDLKKCTFSENRFKLGKGSVYTAIFDYFFLGRPFGYKEKINQSSIVHYETKFKGRKYEFVSEIIPMDNVTLSFLFDKQKEAYIYIDKKNIKKYYFDLSFLE